MKCEGKRCFSFVTLIIAIIILVQTNFLTITIMMMVNSSKQEVETVISKQEEKNSNEESEEWKLSIPKIKVSANIKEGTDGETINNYIGHFKETPNENGNICLVAASAGYKENYFSNLKDLQEGDVVIYTKGDLKKEYAVTTNEVIKKTDWSYLSSTDDNRITLVTGILEEPENRLCVQAIEIN